MRISTAKRDGVGGVERIDASSILATERMRDGSSSLVKSSPGRVAPTDEATLIEVNWFAGGNDPSSRTFFRREMVWASNNKKIPRQKIRLAVNFDDDGLGLGLGLGLGEDGWVY